MTNDEAIRNALSVLDPSDDEQWTNQGLPRVEFLAELMDAPELKRVDITRAAPLFTRQNPLIDAPEGQGAAQEHDSLEDDFPDDLEAQSGTSGQHSEPSDAPVDTLEAELARSEGRIQHLLAAIEVLKGELRDAQSHRARLRERVIRLRGPKHTMNEIRRWLDAQAAQRAQRMSSLQTLASVGITPAALQRIQGIPGSQINPQRRDPATR